MGEKFQLKGCICEASSDIQKLYAIMEEERLLAQRKAISFQRKGALGT